MKNHAGIKRIAVLGAAIFILTAGICSLSAFSQFAENCASITDKTLRLHILANSDSEADQQVKLLVRDRLLAQWDTLFGQAQTKEEAMALALEHQQEIVELAQSVLEEAGCSMAVSVSLERQFFHTRVYDTGTMPAGVYDSLRIVIGDGAGHNWWCVLFPSLCVPSAMGKEEVFTEEEQQVVASDGYDVRFWLVDCYASVKEWLFS
jgi:stage II sporulation protein R